MTTLSPVALIDHTHCELIAQAATLQEATLCERTPENLRAMDECLSALSRSLRFASLLLNRP